MKNAGQFKEKYLKLKAQKKINLIHFNATEATLLHVLFKNF
jgi:hypothetical protein